jgi:hypothetical protein
MYCLYNIKLEFEKNGVTKAEGNMPLSEYWFILAPQFFVAFVSVGEIFKIVSGKTPWTGIKASQGILTLLSYLFLVPQPDSVSVSFLVEIF